MLLLRRKREKKLMTKSSYQLLVTFFLVYTLVWLIVNYYIWIFTEWGLKYKILSEIVLVFLMPDTESLFMSYKKYVKEFESS